MRANIDGMRLCVFVEMNQVGMNCEIAYISASSCVSASTESSRNELRDYFGGKAMGKPVAGIK